MYRSVIKNYKVISKLKPGAQGLVFVVENIGTQAKYVLKSVSVEEKKKVDFEKMVNTWKILCQSKAKDHIVSYVEHFYEGEDSVVIMELCSGGDLETLIQKRASEEKKFSESEVLKVVVEIMSILDEMRLVNFMHRDIKSGNILIGCDGKYKLADLNTSKNLEGKSGTVTMAGTLEYTPPEVVNAESYSFSADVYSTGIVLYEMMVGKTPYAKAGGVAMMDLMLGKYVPISPSLGYSIPLVTLVHSCISTDPALRPTPADVLASAVAVQAALREAREGERKTAQRCVELEKEVADTKKDNSSLKKEMASMKNKFAELEKEVADGKKEMEEVRGLLAQLQKQINAMPTQKNEGGEKLNHPSSPPNPTPTTISSSTTYDANLTNINMWLGDNKKFVLLYKAERDGFKASAFHAKCDNKGATVVIVTSSKDFVFGGYAAVPWTSDGGITADNTGQSFLFSIKNPRNTPPQKFDLVDKAKALFCGSSFGPCFGCYEGIWCKDNANTNSDSNSTVDGKIYANIGGLNGKIFTGQYNFTAKGIEVYQVQ